MLNLEGEILMKKSLIALAVAGALAAPMVAQADATLYGSLRLKVVSADGHDLDVDDNISRIGIMGSVDTNIDGVKAIYRGEWSVDTADSGNFGAGRLAYVGLTGGFGTFALGRQWTPEYTFVTGVTDVLDGDSTAMTMDLTRAANVVAYVTPAMGGFQGVVGVVADGAGNGAGVDNNEDADSYHVAAKYAVAGFTVAAGFIDDASAADLDRTAVSVAYAADALYVAALYQDREDNNAATDDDTYELVGSYAFGDTKVLANYGDMGNDAKGYSVEVQQQLGKQARVFANYWEVNDEAELAGEADTFSAGLRVDF